MGKWAHSKGEAMDPCLPCILAASSWHPAFSDWRLAGGHCRGLRGLGTNDGCIDWPLNETSELDFVFHRDCQVAQGKAE